MFSGRQPTLEDTLTSDAGGSAAVEEALTVTMEELTTWALGACSYTALPVEVATTSDSETCREVMTYLPDLGTAVLVEFADNDETIPYVHVDICAE